MEKNFLSDRIRPWSEAAPWVIDEIRKLERDFIAMKRELFFIRELGKQFNYPRDGKHWIEHLIKEVKNERE
jgi:hypothetical protein